MPLTHPITSAIDLLALHAAHPHRYPVLLESAAHGTAQGRWDVLLVADGNAITLGRDGNTRDQHGQVLADTFLQALDAAFHALPPITDSSDYPFSGGWALLLGYELAGQIEPSLRLPPSIGNVPVAQALRCPAAILRDTASGACVAVAEPGCEHLLESILADAKHCPPLQLPNWRTPSKLTEDAPAQFTDGVRRILDYLAAGDSFQVNLSRGWQAQFADAITPAALHQRLRQHNPAPFAGLFSGDGWAVVSASPERLVSVAHDTVQTRPIAGTRARFAGDDDATRIQELVGHPKERAEHVMLIDLERNDLGRICTPGSVQVDELMVVESYAHVHHIVSNVRGQLRAGISPGQVIAATFPGGTITGAPKVRCMQIIAELEAHGRGAYTGAMGWLGRNGDMDLNILIRSAELEGDSLRFRTGAGIVVDSDPDHELQETRAKARGMLRALGVDG